VSHVHSCSKQKNDGKTGKNPNEPFCAEIQVIPTWAAGWFLIGTWHWREKNMKIPCKALGNFMFRIRVCCIPIIHGNGIINDELGY
jgi:hypothetical protein